MRGLGSLDKYLVYLGKPKSIGSMKVLLIEPVASRDPGSKMSVVTLSLKTNDWNHSQGNFCTQWQNGTINIVTVTNIGAY